MSVFLAVEPDETVRTELTELMAQHRSSCEAKWLTPEKLHCTIVFLGNPNTETIEGWKPLVAQLASRHLPMSLQLKGSGLFATARAPSVLWLGVGGDLSGLCALHVDAARTFGAEARGFVPHVTLARSKGEQSLVPVCEAMKKFESSVFCAESIGLYESFQGAYRLLCREQLGMSTLALIE